MKKLLTYTFLLVGLSLNAQIITPEVISTGGGSYENAYAHMDVTIGEVVTETMTGENNVMTNGFQQGKYNFDFIDDGKAYNVNIWIFPNPVKRLLNIYLESQAVIKLTYSLHDVTGRLVKYGKLNSTANAIHLGDCQPGTYCLSIVSAAGVRVKSFKIVKM